MAWPWVAPPTIANYDMTDDNTDRRHTVSESADKIVLTTKLKRGNGTRDEDRIKVKVKGDDPEDAAMKLAATLGELEAEGVTDTLRETQPDGGEE